MVTLLCVSTLLIALIASYHNQACEGLRYFERSLSIKKSIGMCSEIAEYSDIISSKNKELPPRYDMWIVGCGTLGEELLRLRNRSSNVRVIGETWTEKRHSKISNFGAIARTRGQRTTEDNNSAKTVVISIPPSSSTDYAQEVLSATKLWYGPNGGGSLIFVSSTGVYEENNGETVDSHTPIAPKTESSKR